MSDLKCQATGCIYNTAYACGANTIKVSRTHRETFCDTFTQDNPMVTAERKRVLAEAGAEISAAQSAPKIICTVSECAYNKSFHCKAGGIEIDDPHDSVICNCRTYRPK